MRNFFHKIGYGSVILLLFLSSCSNAIGQTIQNSESLSQAEVVFQVVLPASLDEDQGLYLEILDVVTGVYFNPTRIAMTRNSDTVFMVRIPLTVRAEIAYRYIKISETVVPEFNSRGQPVRMRWLKINGPELVQDLIYSWDGNPAQKPVGRISGQIIDKSNNAPIPEMVISAAGLQTTSSSDGSFILEGVPEGTHNVVIHSKTGSFTTFQQYATVAANATTPIFIGVDRTKTVNVTFIVKHQGSVDPELPVKIAGNLYQLGNSYSELVAGSANRADELPQMVRVAKNKYSLTLELPTGAYIKYKYTQGDGFWNSELGTNGNFFTREFIVPEKDSIVNDSIITTESPNFGNVHFEVTLDPTSPDITNLYLQLNPYDWMEPIPMEKTATGTWVVNLTSPLNLIGNTSYRFCREGDCVNGLSTSPSSSLVPLTDAQTISTTIDGWVNYSNSTVVPSIDSGGLEVVPNSERITGIEVIRNLPDSWKINIGTGFADIQNLGGKWVILTPKWSLSNLNPPMIEPTYQDDASWMEMQQLINYAKLHDLQPVLFPRISPLGSVKTLISGRLPDSWDSTVIDRYKRFIINFADLSEIMELEAIVIGEPSLSSLSTMLPVESFQWGNFVSELRTHFSGNIIGVVTLPGPNTNFDWLSDVDMVYVLYSPTISDQDNIIGEINDQLDSMVYPLFERFKKPILIGLESPSNESAYLGCFENGNSCAFRIPKQESINLSNQSRIYNAVAVTSLSKEWVNGFISRGYDPYLRSQDSGSSIYGKPAYEVLWFWFHFALNLQIQ
jgi:hypothetical protein